MGSETRENSILLAAARDGSEEALGAILDRYGERLLTLIRARLGKRLRREVESRDILQETLLEAFRCLEQFEGSGAATFMGWMAGIAVNQIRYQARHHRRLARDARLRESWHSRLDPAARTIHGEVSRIELGREARRLEAALDSLKESHRAVILLRAYQELPFAEIGERLGKSADACRMLYTRAMVALTVAMHRQGRRAEGNVP